MKKNQEDVEKQVVFYTKITWAILIGGFLTIVGLVIGARKLLGLW